MRRFKNILFAPLDDSASAAQRTEALALRNGASVTLNQSGNGLNSANVPQGANFTNGSTPGITVFSNGAAVSITQSN